ncbi:hypothetical protein PRIPAC_94235 [Pristionchus pacificus]|uniref:Uncharacterized protein n=1 Tax=Pristionchus pacificus TaxID=54126 RepID=A0A454XM25_PRIPA|nr:hypothetical protein PRIPAC_94235 [Pristionchus pacificus]|eukprot:PDM68048.1 hypothetical protein PRIPAC_46092 [Pristionchus pacificus]
MSASATPHSPALSGRASPPPYVSTAYEAFNPVVPASIVTERPPPYPGQGAIEEDARSAASSTDDFTWKDICCCWLLIQGSKAAGKLGS